MDEPVYVLCPLEAYKKLSESTFLSTSLLGTDIKYLLDNS